MCLCVLKYSEIPVFLNRGTLTNSTSEVKVKVKVIEINTEGNVDDDKKKNKKVLSISDMSI